MLFTSLAVLIKDIFLLIGYFNNNSFPKPLKTAEEKIYLQKLEQGDEEAKNILIERNMRLVAHVIKKYDTDVDKEDLISIGTIGLVKAVNTFSIKNGARLATYAARCIDNEILMYLRSTKKIKHEVSLQEPLGFDQEGNEIKYEDILHHEESLLKQVETTLLSEGVKGIISKNLMEQEKNVIVMRYGLDGEKRYTQREVADNLGISRSYVSRIEKKAIQKISQYF